jgi:hypothetical protein
MSAKVIKPALLISTSIRCSNNFGTADTKQIPHLLSDHPANGTRMETLEQHFRDNPAIFSRFNPDPKSATPLTVPKDAPVVFLRP